MLVIAGGVILGLLLFPVVVAVLAALAGVVLVPLVWMWAIVMWPVITICEWFERRKGQSAILDWTGKILGYGTAMLVVLTMVLAVFWAFGEFTGWAAWRKTH